MDLSGAINVLSQAQSALENGAGKLRSAADDETNSAKELVRAVMTAGFDLSGLNEAMGMLEELQNEVHHLAGRAEAIRQKIEEVKTG